MIASTSIALRLMTRADLLKDEMPFCNLLLVSSLLHILNRMWRAKPEERPLKKLTPRFW
jgi:hypothetical protein